MKLVISASLLAGAIYFTASNPAFAQARSAPAKSTEPAPPASAASGERALSGLTVNGARRDVETSIDRRSYSVANDLQAKSGTVSDALRSVPGVQVDVNGNLSLRGDSNVTVLVDGRPSAQFGRDNLAQALQAVPADQIDRIEVLTNPSAEFRADGSAGIINLIMKKAKGAGQTGSLRLTGTSVGSIGESLSNGFNSNKLSFVDNLSIRRERVRIDSKAVRDLVGGGGTQDVVSGIPHFIIVNGRVAVDYDRDSVTRLSASVSGVYQDGPQTLRDRFEQVDANGATVVAFDRVSAPVIKVFNKQVDATLRKKWSDTHGLTVNVAFGDNDFDTTRLDLTSPIVPIAAASGLYFERSLRTKRSALTADYQKTLKDGVQLKAGLLIEQSDNLMNLAGGSGLSLGSITPDAAQTDDFSDLETHTNAYVTLQKAFGKLTALGGLRGETVSFDLDQLTFGIHNDQNYQRLHPSLHFAYAAGKGRTLNASYSKRVTRPGFTDFDPFPVRIGCRMSLSATPI